MGHLRVSLASLGEPGVPFPMLKIKTPYFECPPGPTPGPSRSPIPWVDGRALAGSMTLGIGDFQPSFPSSDAFRGVCVGGLPEMKQKPPY